MIPLPEVPDWPHLLRRAIAGEGIRATYQPIVDLQRGVVAGFEALTRFDIGPRCAPDAWFQAAHHHGVADVLEATTIRAALQSRTTLPPNTFMTINVEPESLSSPVVMQVFAEQGSLAGLVVEVTGQRLLDDARPVQWVLEHLRGQGALIAVDDAGSGYAGVQQILAIRPNILKFDRTFIDGLERDEAKAALIEMFGVFANRIDAMLLAEGVETVGEARRCAAIGVPLAQGFLFARPDTPWASINPAVSSQLPPRITPAHEATLHSIIEAMPSVHCDHMYRARSIFANEDTHHVVVVGDDDQPLGMLTLASMITGEMISIMRASVYSSPHEIAFRLSATTTRDNIPPVIVTDPQGRYMGALPIQRLLATVSNTNHLLL